MRPVRMHASVLFVECGNYRIRIADFIFFDLTLTHASGTHAPALLLLLLLLTSHVLCAPLLSL